MLNLGDPGQGPTPRVRKQALGNAQDSERTEAPGWGRTRI
jgi:hypothetical protein